MCLLIPAEFFKKRRRSQGTHTQGGMNCEAAAINSVAQDAIDAICLGNHALLHIKLSARSPAA